MFDLQFTAVFLMPRTVLNVWCSLESLLNKRVFQETGIGNSPQTRRGVVHRNVCFVLMFLKLVGTKDKYWVLKNLLLKGKLHFINLA